MQCQNYDGAPNMSGVNNGVVKQIQNIDKRAVFIHCNGHIINLAAQDTINKSPWLKQALDYAFEIIKLIKLREAIFGKVRGEIGDVKYTSAGKIKMLCPTRLST